jgi:hypothetical protein
MSMIDTLFAIGVLFVSLIIFSQLAFDVNIKYEQRIAAESMMIVADAAAGYARKHNAELLPASAAASGPTISLDTLRNEGFLRQNFSNTNLWGQTYNVYVRRPTADSEKLRILVVTSGGSEKNRKFRNVTVPGTARLMGASGGFVSSDDVPGFSSGNLTAPAKVWALPFSSVGVANPGPGHLGYLSDYDTSDLAGDFLYRVEVPGNPELNEMHTELDMTDHAVENVKELQFVEREISSETCALPEEQGRVFLDREKGLYICRNQRFEMISDSGNSVPVKSMEVRITEDMVEKPVCPPQTDTVPQIFVTPAIAAAGFEARTLNALQVWADSISDTQWQIHMRVLAGKKDGDDFWVYPDPDYNRILTITTCGKNTVVP